MSAAEGARGAGVGAGEAVVGLGSAYPDWEAVLLPNSTRAFES